MVSLQKTRLLDSDNSLNENSSLNNSSGAMVSGDLENGELRCRASQVVEILTNVLFEAL